jgi:hypothetical protein
MRTEKGYDSRWRLGTHMCRRICELPFGKRGGSSGKKAHKHIGTNGVKEDTNITEVWAMVSVRQPCGFCIGNFAKGSRYSPTDDALLPSDSAHSQPLVLALLEYFMSVKAIESFSSVLAGCIYNQIRNSELQT